MITDKVQSQPLNDSTDYEEFEFKRLLKSAAVLVVDDEPGMRNFLKRALEQHCALLEVAGSAEEAEALRLRYHFDLLLVDIRLPGLSGLDWLRKLRERGVRTHVIYMTAYADLEMAIAALRNDADDFIMKPFRAEQMFISMRRTLTRGRIVRENSLLRLQLDQMRGDEGIVGQSDVMLTLMGQAQHAATLQSAALLQGETGTGKQKVAEAIHVFSRRQGTFVKVDCALLDSRRSDQYPQSVKEESLDNLFSQADKGTLFLDEVAQLSEASQARLAQILETGEIRTGESDLSRPAALRSVDVRILASTSRDLRSAVNEGTFRGDLFFHLNVLPLQVPAVRERTGDIKLLVEHFMNRLSSDMRLTPIELLHADWQLLEQYSWPGNIRELRNVVERTLLGGKLPPDYFVPAISDADWSGPGFPLTWTSEAVERAHIEAVLASVNNNKSAAARILGVSRKTLERKQTLWYGENDD